MLGQEPEELRLLEQRRVELILTLALALALEVV